MPSIALAMKPVVGQTSQPIAPVWEEQMSSESSPLLVLLSLVLSLSVFSLSGVEGVRVC